MPARRFVPVAPGPVASVTAGCSTVSRSLACAVKGWLLRASWAGDP